MKKLTILALCALLCLALIGCGGSEKAPAATAAPAATQAPAPEPTAVPEVTQAPEITEAPAETAPDNSELIAKILAMRDQPVQDLYDLIGEPVGSDYSPSCLITGGQDGQLYYDGFTVYTLVSRDGTETIFDCE